MPQNEEYLTIIKEKCYNKNNNPNPHANKKSWWENNKILYVYEDIMKFTAFLPNDSKIGQRMYHYLSNTNSIPVCKRECCKNSVNWYKFVYQLYCSTKCSSTDTVDKRKQTSMERYGVDNPSKSPEIIQKIKDVTFEKYGVENYSFTDKFKTRMKSLWVDNKEEWLIHREESNLQKFGWKTPFENADVLQKTKDTMIERYGVKHALQVPEFLNKAINTNIERYGVKNFLQKDVDPELINNRNDINWIKVQMEIMSVKQMARKFNVTPSTICQTIKKHGISLVNYSGNENEIYDYVSKLYNGEITRISRKILKSGKELDIYLPDMNLAIEHNGTYWHQERKGKDNKYHLNKTIECNEMGIHLLHIFESEWDYKKDIVKSIIASKLGITDKLYARKCIIKSVDKSEEKQFLNENHIQGYVSSNVCLGLYSNDELVQIMSFGKSRFNKKFDNELLRLATKLNKTVTGGAQKLLNHYIKEYDPSNIISYCDLRLFSGEVYKKLNFDFSHNSNPGYYYVDQWGNLHNRMQFQKSKLERKLDTYDAQLTEEENMFNNGYHRIWDCGNSVWTMILKRQE